MTFEVLVSRRAIESDIVIRSNGYLTLSEKLKGSIRYFVGLGKTVRPLNIKTVIDEKTNHIILDLMLIGLNNFKQHKKNRQ